jgi:DNA-binding CsgD family transcriptional regulator
MAANVTTNHHDAVKRPGRKPTSKLSAREEEVLRQLAWGATHQEVADSLKLSVKTIEAHKANATRKLRLRTRRELVSYAVQHGWLSLQPITEVERRIAALKQELASMKSIVAAGLANWSADKPVDPKVNDAFRRVLEIGASLQAAKAVLDPPEES